MQLYYSPLACSFVVRVVLTEAGLDADTVRVSLQTKQTAAGEDYHTISPKAQVPALRLDDGTLMTEGPAVVQYIADLVPERGLAPPMGTRERYELMQWLNFISSELHKGSVWPIFHPHSDKETRAFARWHGERCFAYLDDALDGRAMLVGDGFTVADAYLAWVLMVAQNARYDLARWPNVAAYAERQQARPSVKAALAVEYPQALEDYPRLGQKG